CSVCGATGLGVTGRSGNASGSSPGSGGVPSGRDNSRESRSAASNERFGRPSGLADEPLVSLSGGSLMDEQQRNETVRVDAAEASERLDRVLANHVSGLSRSRLKALVQAGRVAMSGRTIRDPGHRVNAGDLIVVEVPPPEPAQPRAEAIPLAVVYE